ncbi:MAG: serine hydrolase domain-containing protein [Thermomicrobiales bacterium]
MTETVIPTAKAWPTDNLLQEMIGKTVADIGFPGAIALLSTPGRETWIASFGTSDRATNAPTTADMHTRVGSITKMFTATIVLQLVDDGSFSLDDTLTTTLPSAANLPHAERISIRHLLNMRSGIYNYTEDGEAFAKLFASTENVWTHEQLIDIVRAHDAYFEPGTEFHYSNTNYILLEMIIERVTERPFGELLQERLLTPLGLSGTVLPSSPSMPEPFAHGFGGNPAILRAPRNEADAEGEAIAPVTPPETIDTTEIPTSAAAGAGALVSTASDLDRWLHALKDGFSISEELQRERMRLEPTGESHFAYGLGVMTHGRLIGHGGGIPGYTSFAGYDPITGANVVVLVNGEGNGTPTGSAMAVVDAIVALLPGEPTAIS